MLYAFKFLKKNYMYIFKIRLINTYLAVSDLKGIIKATEVILILLITIYL